MKINFLNKNYHDVVLNPNLRKIFQSNAGGPFSLPTTFTICKVGDFEVQNILLNTKFDTSQKP